MQKEIEYNPSLSVSENAKANGISVDAMRYYIKKNGIDRRYEQKTAIINMIIKYRRYYPDATPNEIARRTKKSVNTIKKYWDYSNGDDLLIPSIKKDKRSRLSIRGNNDFMNVPASTIDYLLKNDGWKTGKKIIDPCNKGGVSNILQEKGYIVLSQDMNDISDFKRFLSTNYIPYGASFITRPPKDVLASVIRKCIDSSCKITAIYMPLKYLFMRHHELDKVFQYKKPIRVYAYYPKERDIDKDYNNQYEESDETYAWFIWDTFERYRNRTTIHWVE